MLNQNFSQNRPRIIFFGNGKLADYALAVLEKYVELVFHARTKEDLEKVKAIKAGFNLSNAMVAQDGLQKAQPVKSERIYGVLASFGVMIKEDVLKLFEPEGILNIHPSLLPKYRGASPIESAILAGDTDFSVSVMKLVKAMDAGPVYFQETFSDLPLQKDEIYKVLAEAGAEWIGTHIARVPDGSATVLPKPRPQEGEPSFTSKLDKSMSVLDPTTDTTAQLYRKIVAYQDFPKPKYAFYGQNCIILEAKPLRPGETAPLMLTGRDGANLAILRLQPEGRKPMDAQSFLNGYAKK